MATTTSSKGETPLNTENVRESSLPRIIFLHGFLGSGSDWLTIARQLEKEYCCMPVDLPGHGESGIAANDNPDLFFSETVDALAELIRKTTSPPCFLVGYSMGGRVALSLLLRHPALFAKAIILSASPGLRTEEERNNRKESDEGIARKIERNFDGFIEAWL